MPEAVKRHFADYGDSRRMEQFADLRPNESGSHDYASIFVHDYSGVADIAVCV
jgi:hypothetical protein